MAARGLPGRDEPPESVTQLSDDLEELIGSFDLQGPEFEGASEAPAAWDIDLDAEFWQMTRSPAHRGGEPRAETAVDRPFSGEEALPRSRTRRGALLEQGGLMSSTGQPQNEAAPSREPVPSASGGAGAEASGSAVVGSESPPQQGRKKRTFKRAKTAEEREQRLKARNRSAQKAFRVRQKNKSQEQEDVLQTLQAELAEVRQENAELLRRIQEVERKLQSPE